jgi:hypothetical protein
MDGVHKDNAYCPLFGVISLKERPRPVFTVKIEGVSTKKYLLNP